jgi:chorismate dehydratase
VPPDRLQTLWVDGDSHTSIALANVLWRELYDRELEILPFDARHRKLDEVESVLLIGDKVVDPARGSFAYEVDLGGAWRQHTGLPFVFAVWATLSDEATERRSDGGKVAAGASSAERARAGLGGPALRWLSQALAQARDLGVARADEIARTMGPELGWPVEQARRYLTRCLKYRLDTRSIEGANLFGQLCAEAGIIPSDSAIAWPTDLLTQEAV